MNVQILIEKYQLSDAEANALRFMEATITPSKKIGIREVAKHAYVSTATIVNMSKKLGFSGYSDLVFSFQNQPAPQTLSTELITKEEYQKFAQLLKKYQNKRIMILASGFSQNLANYFSEFLNLHGFRAMANSHLELLRPSTESEALIILISHSGETQRLVELSVIADKHQIDIIAFVGESQSKIGQLATLAISTNTFSTKGFHEFAPNLFFGTALNQFELLMSHTLQTLFE